MTEQTSETIPTEAQRHYANKQARLADAAPATPGCQARRRVILRALRRMEQKHPSLWQADGVTSGPYTKAFSALLAEKKKK